MTVIPISSYPMPSDKRSQAQVLQEQKTELTHQAQAVEQSPMDERDKRRIISRLGDRISETSREMGHDYAEYSFERHRRNTRAQEKRTEAADARQTQTAGETRKDSRRKESAGLDVTV